TTATRYSLDSMNNPVCRPQNGGPRPRAHWKHRPPSDGPTEAYTVISQDVCADCIKSYQAPLANEALRGYMARMSRILIMSALPYINGVKHPGNLAGSMLPADVYARFQRLAGNEVLFICATDEHGTPAELAAAEEGETPAQYCARLHDIQKDVADRFAL